MDRKPVKTWRLPGQHCFGFSSVSWKDTLGIHLEESCSNQALTEQRNTWAFLWWIVTDWTDSSEFKTAVLQMFEMCCLKVTLGSRVAPRLQNKGEKGIWKRGIIFEFGWNGKQNLCLLWAGVCLGHTGSYIWKAIFSSCYHLLEVWLDVCVTVYHLHNFHATKSGDPWQLTQAWCRRQTILSQNRILWDPAFQGCRWWVATIDRNCLAAINSIGSEPCRSHVTDTVGRLRTIKDVVNVIECSRQIKEREDRNSFHYQEQWGDHWQLSVQQFWFCDQFCRMTDVDQAG